MMQSRQGAAQIDWIVSLVLFLSIVSIVFIQLSQMTFSSDISQASKGQSLLAKRSIEDESIWELIRQDSIVQGSATQQRPIELNLSLSSAKDNNSVSVQSSDGSVIPSDYYPNERKLVFESNITNRSQFSFFFSEDTNLSEYAYATNLSIINNTNDYVVRTSRTNATCDTSGLANVVYKEVVFISDIQINSVIAKPSLVNGSVRAKCIYDDTNVSMYASGTHIFISKPSAERIVFLLRLSEFDRYYNGTVNTIPLFGTVDSGTRSWIDFYSTSGNGMSIFAQDASVVVTSDSTVDEIQVQINGQKDIELFFHDGNYTNAQNESLLIATPPSVFIKPSRVIKGLDAERVENYTSLSYSELQDRFGTSFNLNVTLPSSQISLGKPLPRDIPVYMHRFPVTILSRFGEQFQDTLEIGIWE